MRKYPKMPTPILKDLFFSVYTKFIIKFISVSVYKFQSKSGLSKNYLSALYAAGITGRDLFAYRKSLRGIRETTSAQPNEKHHKICNTEHTEISRVYIELLENVQLQPEHIADHKHCQQALQTQCEKCIQSKYQAKTVIG